MLTADSSPHPGLPPMPWWGEAHCCLLSLVVNPSLCPPHTLIMRTRTPVTEHVTAVLGDSDDSVQMSCLDRTACMDGGGVGRQGQGQPGLVVMGLWGLRFQFYGNRGTGCCGVQLGHWSHVAWAKVWARPPAD